MVTGSPHEQLGGGTDQAVYRERPTARVALRKASKQCSGVDRQLGGGDKQIEISWPAAYGGMVLESNPDPNDSVGWAPVLANVQTNNGSAFVVIEGSATSRFYRLKQP